MVSANDSGPISKKALLTVDELVLLKSFGAARAKAHIVKTTMDQMFPGRRYDKQLLYRIMAEGRSSFGDDDGSFILFVERGLEIRREGGTFDIHMCSDTNQVSAWSLQLPISVQLAEAYGDDSYYVDTTHKATKWGFKTGPVSVVDAFGHTAPAGIFQVPEEEIDLVLWCLRNINLASVGAVAATDGGSAWPAVVEELHQVHVEDTWHNVENAIKKSSQAPDPSAFRTDASSVLYDDLGEAGLDSKLLQMAQYAKGTGIERWVDDVSTGKVKKCFTYTGRHFICSLKGGLSRCEQAMSSLKASGSIKEEMAQFSIMELMKRYESVVDDYVDKVEKSLEKAILNVEDTTDARWLSKYVTEKESAEQKLSFSYRIVSTSKNASNPFHTPPSDATNDATMELDGDEAADDGGAGESATYGVFAISLLRYFIVTTSNILLHPCIRLMCSLQPTMLSRPRLRLLLQAQSVRFVIKTIPIKLVPSSSLTTPTSHFCAIANFTPPSECAVATSIER